MDPISLAVGGGVFLFGWLVGRATRRPKAPKPLALMCSCGHGYGTHEDSQRCHGMKYQDVYEHGEWMGDRAPCPCRSYDGPEPLPRAWVPPELPEMKKELER